MSSFKFVNPINEPSNRVRIGVWKILNLFKFEKWLELNAPTSILWKFECRKLKKFNVTSTVNQFWGNGWKWSVDGNEILDNSNCTNSVGAFRYKQSNQMIDFVNKMDERMKPLMNFDQQKCRGTESNWVGTASSAHTHLNERRWFRVRWLTHENEFLYA